jgi:hypothetical protein
VGLSFGLDGCERDNPLPSGIRTVSHPTRRESLSLSHYELLAKVNRDGRNPAIGKIDLIYTRSSTSLFGREEVLWGLFGRLQSFPMNTNFVLCLSVESALRTCAKYH